MIFNMFKTAREIMFNKKVSGMKATNVQDAVDELHGDKLGTDAAPQDIGLVCGSANGGSGSNVTLEKNVITTLPLKAWIANNDDNIYYYLASDGSIEILETGWYLIAASAYVRADTYTGVNMRSVYIFNGSTEIAGAVDHAQQSGAALTGGVGISPKVVQLNAGDKLYLKGRVQFSTGYISPANNATYFTIARLGW